MDHLEARYLDAAGAELEPDTKAGPGAEQA
jgi:hypothetical protein